MGVTVKAISLCQCKENKINENMRIIAQRIEGSKIDFLYECPVCKMRVNLSVKLFFDDTHKGMRVYYVSEDDTRLLVLVCDKCQKLIGTRENFYIHRKKNKKGKFEKVPYCEGCHEQEM